MKSEKLQFEIMEDLEDFCKGCRFGELSIHRAYDFDKMAEEHRLECGRIGLCRQLWERFREIPELEEKGWK